MATEEKGNILSKSFDHILISASGEGPSFTLGKSTFKFRAKIPVTAVIKLVSNANNYEGMVEYILESMDDKRQHQAFRDLLSDIDGDGLAQILEWLTEATTGFQSATPAE